MRDRIFKASDAAKKNIAEFATDELSSACGIGREEGCESGADSEEPVDTEALREAILAEAREEALQKIQEAYDRGLALGREAGEAQFRASVAEITTALEAAGQAMRKARETFLGALEPQVVELATLIAERVLDREVRMDPTLVNATARRALGILADRQRLHVRVNPADLDALNAHKLSLLHDFSGIVTLEVVADADVSPGGCIVTSETMEVDARLDTLLAEILDTLSE